MQFRIENLTFYYADCDKPAISEVSLEIKKGEYITICGKSGSGKSTLLKHLKKPLAPYGKKSGRVLYEGCEIEKLDERVQASHIGYVLQNPDAQLVTDKVWHELAFGLESLGLDTDTIRTRVAEMASFFGISEWFYKDVNELSGGQKQLLNLASVMAMQPQVLILDEPTSQLDPVAASEFLQTVKRINDELGTTVIITEHRLEEVFCYADRVVVLDEARVIADDKPAAVVSRLSEGGSSMTELLPAAARIYSDIRIGEPPLTVKEGSMWLSSLGMDKSAALRSIPEPVLPDMDSPAIAVKEIWYTYDKKERDVLRGTSLAVPRGCMYAIVGANSAGKTTLLKAMCGIVKPYRGNIYIDGKRIDKYKKNELYEQNVAMLPQNPASLFVKKTVEGELAEMTDDKAYIEEVVKLCELEKLLNKHPYDISGGEQQRTALAKVLLTRPKILLLDEPTKGMDNIYKKEFARILRSIPDITVVMVSHDLEFCASYFDVVSLLFNGEIVTTNTANKFFSGNSFYTTAANRMSRHIFSNAVTREDVVYLCRKNLESK